MSVVGKEDRRIRYTKEKLREAMIRLMQGKHISKITVKELCELADINRSTFYTHYNDPDDLLQSMERELFNNLMTYLVEQDLFETRTLPVQQLKNIVDYAKENASWFKAMMSENGDSAFQKDLMRLIQMDEADGYKIKGNLSRRKLDYLNLFAVSGCLSILQKWLHDGMVESTLEMSQLAINLLENGTRGVMDV